MKRLSALAVLFLLLVTPQWASADSVAVSFTGFPGAANQDLNIGWSFRVDTALDVTALGYFDLDGDGLNGPHSVGIFELATGTLLNSTVVGAGTSGTLLDGFRYAAITPYHLDPGVYFLMANNPLTDAFIGFASGFSVDPRITYGVGVYSFGGAVLQAPTNLAGVDPSLFGPNMLIADALPVPSSLALILAGLLSLRFGVTRRRT